MNRNKNAGAFTRWTYCGERIDSSELKVSPDAYKMIKRFNLGNLSGLSKIPEFYMRFLLGYIIQVSRALAHAHEHDLIHGKLDLSKVIAQQKKIRAKKFEKIMASKTYRKRQQTKKSKQPLFEQTDFTYNFYVTNFEPYQVFNFLKKSLQEESLYLNILKIDGMKLDEETALQLMKVTDLQSFGNSVVEIMVGRCEASANEQLGAKMEPVLRMKSSPEQSSRL